MAKDERLVQIPVYLIEAILEIRQPAAQEILNELRKLCEDQFPDKWKSIRNS